MNTKILTKLGPTINKIGLQLKKHSPEILMGLGIAGSVTSTVLACKATTKVGEIMEEKDKVINNIHTCLEDPNIEYTEEDSKKDLTIIYTQTGMKLVKLYAPAAALGALSISAIIGGHTILKKRNAAIAAAYAVVDRSFKDYRKRVVDRFGSEVDKELKYNIQKKTITETIIDENGEQKTVEREINTIDENDPLYGISEFAKFFDCGSDQHRKDPEYNLMFLRRQQDYANERLKAKGHLFLNEVYDLLGIPRTKTGQQVGWIYDEKNPIGDNYVDFGIYDPEKLANRMFVNGYEYNILLDFNVDGVIYDLI